MKNIFIDFLSQKAKSLSLVFVFFLLSLVLFTDVADFTCKNAQSITREKLRSPITAVFPSCSTNMFVELDGEDPYMLGYVDSQNGFGAMRRSNFICYLEKDTFFRKIEDCDFFAQ